MAVNFRNFGQAKQVLPKYLTDSITPWWGAWSVNAGVFEILFDTLPIGDAIARLKVTAAGTPTYFILRFNETQNLSNYVLDWWEKCEDNASQLRMFATTFPGSLTDYSAYYSVWAAGSAPTVWTRKIISLSAFTTLFGSASKNTTISKVKDIWFYHDSTTVGKYLTISGMTFRRP